MRGERHAWGIPFVAAASVIRASEFVSYGGWPLSCGDEMTD